MVKGFNLFSIILLKEEFSVQLVATAAAAVGLLVYIYIVKGKPGSNWHWIL